VSQYLPILGLLVLAAAFGGITLLASKLLAPRRSTVAKLQPYECGIVPGREPPQRFPVRFYLVAMIFIVFDIELIFLYPWVLIHRELALFGLVAMGLFALMVFESFIYLLSKGGLDWGPAVSPRRQDELVRGERTAAATIRRVGLEGRYDTEVAA
jgi:NADH-quinone oxidoreductase subunit A